MATTIELPEGFTLDEAPTNNTVPALPEGFTLDSQPSKPSTFSDSVLRPLARTARTGLAGAVSIADPVNIALGQQPASESIKSLFDKATNNFAAPRNKLEQITDKAGELFTGGGAISKFAKAAAPAAKGTSKIITDALKVESTQDFGALAGGSIGVPVAQETAQKTLDVYNIKPDSKLRVGADILAGLVGGVTGGMAGAKMTRIPTDFKNYVVMKDLPRSAKTVAKDLDSQGMTPQQAIKALEGDAGLGLSPIDVNTAQISNLKDLGQIAGSRKILENAFDAREKNIIKAQKNILKGVEGDESHLVTLSREYKDKLVNKMKEASRPLYKSGLSKGTQIPEDTIIAENLNPEIQGILQVKSNNLTLKDLLQSPIVKESIATARNKSLKYSNTPAMDIYGNIHQKTKPVYQTKTTERDVLSVPVANREEGYVGFAAPQTREVRLGAAANNIVPEYTTKTQLKEPAAYKVPDNDVRVLNAVDSILYDKIGEIGLTGYNKEQTALKLVRSGISKIVDEASPELKEAKQIWSRDTQDIMTQDKSVLGVISRFAADKQDQAMDKLIKLSPKEISKAKVKLMSIDPDRYDQMVKGFIDRKIASLKNNQEVTKLISSDLDRQKMRAIFPNSNTFQGFEKAINYIEKTKPTQDALRSALRREIEAAPLKESTAIQKTLGEKIVGLPSKAVKKTRELSGFSEAQEKIEVDKKEAEILARYAFTDEGKQLFSELAKTTKRADIDKNMARIKGAILNFLSTKSQGEMNIDFMSDANAEENLSTEDIRRQMLEQQKQIPSSYTKEDLETQPEIIKKRFYR